MKTRDEYAAEAEILLGYATETSTNYDDTNPAAALLFAQAQVYATLATVAPAEQPPVPVAEAYIPVALSIRLREIHQDNNNACTTCVEEDGTPMCWPCETFTALTNAERQLSPIEDEPSIDEVMSASEQHELDQADEFALDAAADAEQDGGDPR